MAGGAVQWAASQDSAAITLGTDLDLRGSFIAGYLSPSSVLILKACVILLHAVDIYRVPKSIVLLFLIWVVLLTISARFDEVLSSRNQPSA